MRRGSLFWGIVLLLLGVLMFADSAGVKFLGGARPMDFFWPLILLILGAWVIFGVFMRGHVDTQQASIDLQGATSAGVRLSHGAGRLQIRGGAAMGQLATGSFAGGLRQSSSKTGDRLEVRMRPESDFMPFWGQITPLDWNVQFNNEIPMTMRLEIGADEADIDLHDFCLTDLKLDTGASKTRITLPARGRVHADFDLGAASLEIIIPDGVSARLRISQGISGVSIAPRFLQVGNVYQSSDFESATNAVDMTIDAGAADIKVR